MSYINILYRVLEVAGRAGLAHRRDSLIDGAAYQVARCCVNVVTAALKEEVAIAALPIRCILLIQWLTISLQTLVNSSSLVDAHPVDRHISTCFALRAVYITTDLDVAAACFTVLLIGCICALACYPHSNRCPMPSIINRVFLLISHARPTPRLSAHAAPGGRTDTVAPTWRAGIPDGPLLTTRDEPLTNQTPHRVSLTAGLSETRPCRYQH